MMEQAHKPTAEQKKRALMSGVVLGLTALAVYFVMILKLFASR